MHLKTIKLAGFKSFVDPTTVVLQSNLTAIVGPNGCGKSNVIDAIRWVIGESSAKQLRGELLTDVIFSGTTQRKPVGQAAVELLFDNSAGSLGGAYAQYQEISIRREIQRDGQSVFYLNGVRCRRRDILDVFLGTGLGPNSYAIIEQGVISQMIEGKPEDIRVYLEEAAGISKYRERRRETENRIRHTRENLERLQDLRTEMAKQLDHLKRQANAALRYKSLKQDQRLVKAQWQALHCAALQQELTRQQQELSSFNEQLTEKTQYLEQLDQELVSKREQQTVNNDHCNSIQTRYYESNELMARQEQQIQHLTAQQQQVQTDLEKIAVVWSEAEQNRENDQANLQAFTREISELTPELAASLEKAAQSQAALPLLEEQRKNWQQTWDSYQTQASQLAQKTHGEKTRHHELSQKIQHLEQHITRLQAQLTQLDSAALPEQIGELTEQTRQRQQQLDELQQTIHASNEQIQQQRTLNQQAQLEQNQLQQQFHQLQNQRATLEALQQAALGKTTAGMSHWLQQQQLHDKPRLLEQLKVAAGWEAAVETVLGPYLEAICTDSNADWLTITESLTQGRLTLLQPARAHTSASNTTSLLSSKIQSAWDIHGLIPDVHIAETTTEALALSATLSAQQSVVTRNGIWFGANWVRLSRNTDETSGVLARQQALQEIVQALAEQEQRLQNQQTQLKDGQQRLLQLEETRDRCQREFRDISAQYSELHAKQSAKQAQFEQLCQREAATAQELQIQQHTLATTIEQQQAAELNYQQALSAQEQHEQNREELLRQREQFSSEHQRLSQSARVDKATADELQVRVTTLENQTHYLQQNIDRAEKQLLQWQSQREDLTRRLQEIETPLPDLRQQLQDLTTQRQTVENELATAREQLHAFSQELTQLEKTRRNEEQQLQHLRDHQEKIRIEQSTTQAHFENHLTQITETQHSLETLLQEMPEEAQISTWQQQLEQLDQRIQRLGAINLAAIEEHDALAERKTHLDDQDKDLCEALATLEEAIRKMDKESRQRLQETFNQANTQFKLLFTRMFNGGNAELELTGEEVLDSGVIIRAQPPGKRNTLLHLLSGGEKALTAIALVFALFQLNPAPFCILDEVDAPLDEANVSRYCRLVESMSETVQFIFISHNKVAMAMAKQLVGVTMHEPGVSRLVSVDIDEAVAMATA